MREALLERFPKRYFQFIVHHRCSETKVNYFFKIDSTAVTAHGTTMADVSDLEKSDPKNMQELTQYVSTVHFTTFTKTDYLCYGNKLQVEKYFIITGTKFTAEYAGEVPVDVGPNSESY